MLPILPKQTSSIRRTERSACELLVRVVQKSGINEFSFYEKERFCKPMRLWYVRCPRLQVGHCTGFLSTTRCQFHSSFLFFIFTSHHHQLDFRTKLGFFSHTSFSQMNFEPRHHQHSKSFTSLLSTTMDTPMLLRHHHSSKIESPFLLSQRRGNNSSYRSSSSRNSNDSHILMPQTSSTATTTTTTTTTKSLTQSKAIPITPPVMKRTASQLKLLEEEALAEFRDYCMYTRITNGIYNNNNNKHSSNNAQRRWTEPPEKLQHHILNTRHLPLDDLQIPVLAPPPPVSSTQHKVNDLYNPNGTNHQHQRKWIAAKQQQYQQQQQRHSLLSKALELHPPSPHHVDGLGDTTTTTLSNNHHNTTSHLNVKHHLDEDEEEHHDDDDEEDHDSELVFDMDL